MQLRDIAWASVKRRRGRFAFMLLAVALGIATVVTLLSVSRAMEAEVGDELDRFGANIVVTPKARELNLAYGGLALGGLTVDAEELTIADAGRIRQIPNAGNISAVAPKLIGTYELEGRPVLLIGARFDQEQGIKSWWELDGRLPTGSDEAALGAQASEVLGLGLTDELVLANRTVRVTGVLRPSGSMDDQAIFVPLPVAQALFGRPDAVSLIEVSALCRGCPIEDIVEQIAAALPHARVAPIRQAVAVREQAVQQFSRFALAVSVLVLLAGGLVIMSTMVASVTERTHEIGILRAIGFRRRQVGALVMMETMAVSAAGGAVGWAAGLAAASQLGPLVAQVAVPTAPQASVALASVGLAMLLGGLAGIHPARRAARLDPMQALRHL